jgi:hypothetical protein
MSKQKRTYTITMQQICYGILYRYNHWWRELKCVFILWCCWFCFPYHCGLGYVAIFLVSALIMATRSPRSSNTVCDNFWLISTSTSGYCSFILLSSCGLYYYGLQSYQKAKNEHSLMMLIYPFIPLFYLLIWCILYVLLLITTRTVMRWIFPTGHSGNLPNKEIPRKHILYRNGLIKI